MSVILASASPRRRELLRLIYDEFEVIPADADETLPAGLPAAESAEYLACKKAGAVAAEHPDSVVIGSDTVVLLGDRILGKPADENAAREMLTSLSGRAHTVNTGVAVFFGGRSFSFSESTEVIFHPLTEAEIDGYIATGEPFDKAGAYGIQGRGALLVKEIHGDYFNVVGLPVSALARVLKRFSII